MLVNRINYIFIGFALFCISCASTGHLSKIPEVNPSVRINLKVKSDTLPPELLKYQLRLDSLLLKASAREKSFTALRSEDKTVEPTYSLIVTIDSVYLVSPEVQNGVLKIKDSVNNALSNRQNKFDSTYKPLTPEERAAASIAATIAMNAVLLPFGFAGYMIVGDASRPNLTYSERHALKKAHFNPKITGEIELVRKASDEVVWENRFSLVDQYERRVDYNEQVDMLIRWLIGKIRFSFNTPFIGEKE